MQWGTATSDSLAALRTLVLNEGWDEYWQRHQLLHLDAASSQPLRALSWMLVDNDSRKQT